MARSNEVDDEAAIGVSIAAGLVLEDERLAIGSQEAAGCGKRGLGVAGVRHGVAEDPERAGALEAVAAAARCR